MSNLMNEYNLLALGLTYLLHSSVWILIVGCVIKARIWQSAFMENALWKVALVGGLFTTTLSLVLGQHRVDINKPITQAIETSTELIDRPEQVENLTIPAQLLEGEREETIDLESPVFKEGARGIGGANSFKRQWSLIQLAPMIWGIMLLVILLYRTTQHLWFFRHLGPRKEIENPTVLHIMESIQRRTKRPVQYRISASPFLDSPIVIRGSEICLPSKALHAMNRDQLEAMIAHEWAHIVRRDHYWAIFSSLLNTLFFFQPLHRLAKAEIERTNELLCDEYAARVTGKALALAECLVAVASWIKPHARKPLLVAGMALRKSELSSRITQLLNIPDMKIEKFRKLKLGVPSLLLLAVTILVLPGFRFVSQQVSPERISEQANPIISSAVVLTAESVPVATSVPTPAQVGTTQVTENVSSETPVQEAAPVENPVREAITSMQTLSGQPLTEVESILAGSADQVQFEALPLSALPQRANCADLLRAVKAEDTKLVRELLKSVDPDCAYYDEGEPRSSLVAAARMGNMEITKLLLSAKANVEYKAKGDESPLMAAANYGHLELVKLLVGSGAKINRKISGDGTALIGAVRGGHYEVAKFLLEKGANPFAMVSGDEYAMYHARMNEDKKMIKLLKLFEEKE
ncbi:MAG: ankyrin repeat domain-containing protein [Saprospiraceae bacterium]|nr:ankyrin repeat domain-containing protein [Saprospiraceae bacterium]